MRAPILALLDRSLRLDSRALVTYLPRLGLLVLIFFSLIIAHVTSLRVGAPGLAFFSPIVYINLVFIALLGVGYFSSVIAEEKEEMTLGLLRLTGLNALGIILGKSASRLVGGLMLLLAQVPFTLLAVTLGGVSLRQLVAAYATLMAFMVLVGGLALLASVVCRSTVRAAALTLVLMVAPLVVGPIARAALARTGGGGPLLAAAGRLSEWLVAANPFVRVAEIMRTGFAGHPVGTQVLSHLGVAALCVVLAWALFGLATREQHTAAPARGLLLPRASRVPWLKIARPWRDAVAWKEFHFFTGGRVLLVVRAIALAVLTAAVVALFAALGSPMPIVAVGVLMMIVPLVLASLELIVHASRTVREEMNWHTLAPLATLPLSPSRLLWSKTVGFLPVLLPYGACFLVGAGLSAAADPGEFVEGLAAVFASGVPWYAAVNVVAFTHFVLLVSLFVRRAAVPVAFVVWLVGAWRIQGSFLSIFALGSLGPAVFCTVMSVVLAGLTVLIHWGTCARLERVAGD